MATPASDLFAPLSLAGAYNADRNALPEPLAPPYDLATSFGSQAFRGVPFDLGSAGGPNVVLVAGSPVTVSAGGRPARYLVFLHQVEDRASNYLTGFADSGVDGNELGDHVADYVLRYTDGSEHVHPLRRRFAIQQARIGWGASPFAAVPMYEDRVAASATEDQAAGRLSTVGYGRGETRHGSGRDGGQDLAWLYALPNPHPELPSTRSSCGPAPSAARCTASPPPTWPTIRCVP